MKFQTKLLTKAELKDLVFDKELWEFKIKLFEEECRSPLFAGFRYFNPSDLVTRHEHFFVTAFDGDQIVGVIKYGLYDCHGEAEPHYGINYIDVRADYRRQGVATALTKEFFDTLPSNIEIHLTALSDEGLYSRMDLLFKKYGENHNVLAYEDRMLQGRF